MTSLLLRCVTLLILRATLDKPEVLQAGCGTPVCLAWLPLQCFTLDQISLLQAECSRPVRFARLPEQAVTSFGLQQQQLTMQAGSGEGIILLWLSCRYAEGKLVQLQRQVFIQPCTGWIGVHLNHTAVPALSAHEGNTFIASHCKSLLMLLKFPATLQNWDTSFKIVCRPSLQRCKSQMQSSLETATSFKAL